MLAMPNSSTISGINLVPGSPQAFPFVVLANSVQADGTNPGVPDTTTATTFEPVQLSSGPTAAVVMTIDPNNNRRCIVTTGPGLTPGSSTPTPWSFRIKAAGRTEFLTVSGSSAAPADVSGVFSDGTAPSPA